METSKGNTSVLRDSVQERWRPSRDIYLKIGLGLKRHYSKLAINYTACIRDLNNVEFRVERGVSTKDLRGEYLDSCHEGRLDVRPV